MINNYLFDEKYFPNVVYDNNSLDNKHIIFIDSMLNLHLKDVVKPMVYFGEQRFWCDGLYLRGFMLAAMAFEGNIDKVNMILDDLLIITCLTDIKGRWIRDYIYIDSVIGKQVKQEIENRTLEDSQYWQLNTVDEKFIIWTDVSRDQMYGLIYGLTIAKKFINDQVIQDKIKNLAEMTINQLSRDGFKLLNPCGTLTRFNNVSPKSPFSEYSLIPLNLFLLADDNKSYEKYFTTYVKYSIRYLPYDFEWFNRTNCNNQFMNNVGNFCLHLLTNDIYYKENLKKQNKRMNHYCNSMWIFHTYFGEENIKENEDIINAIKMLELFPSSKSLKTTKTNNVVDACYLKNRYGQRTAKMAIHPAYNNDFFNWTLDTRNLDVLEFSVDINFAPSDYLIAYQLGKKMNLF